MTGRYDFESGSGIVFLDQYTAGNFVQMRIFSLNPHKIFYRTFCRKKLKFTIFPEISLAIYLNLNDLGLINYMFSVRNRIRNRTP